MGDQACTLTEIDNYPENSDGLCRVDSFSPTKQRKIGVQLSKKSHPGDGDHGRGEKGVKELFKPLFDVSAESKRVDPTLSARQADPLNEQETNPPVQ